MEYVRHGQNLAGFKENIERVISDFDRKLENARALNETSRDPIRTAQRTIRIGRLERHLDRLLDKLAAIEDGLEPELAPVSPLVSAPPPPAETAPEEGLMSIPPSEPLSPSSTDPEKFFFPNPSREGYRRHAVERLGAYLESPEEKVLRPHQVDTLTSVFNHFRSGKTSGTIVLPTGAGKTHVAAELMRILGIPTVMFSTSKDILAQNSKTIASVWPGSGVTNFYGDEKNLSGHVINTLYQSFPSLERQMGQDLGKFGLVIYDEADLSLGEERHKIHAQFPNAIKIALTATPYYEQLEGYEERGIINPEDEWVETFRNIIHQMTPEEALEQGIIPPLDIHLVKTNIAVPNIEVGADGNLNSAQLLRYLNTKSRNALVMAMIAGIDALPHGFAIPEVSKDEIRKIHEKIKGKRMLVHGMNVAHILDIEANLMAAGIRAKAIYGEMTEDRTGIISQVKTGEIQVIIGDQLTGRGLDIPELEVGIHAAPTLSGRELAQQVGRLFRHSPQTGKEKGIVIQLVDTHLTQGSRQPVLIPSIFEPGFVLKGISRGREIKREATRTRRSGLPAVSIEGSIDLDAYFEEIRLQDLIFSRFKDASLGEINNIIMDMYENLITKHLPQVPLYEVYSQLVNQLPKRISMEVNRKAITAITAGGSEAAVGKQILIAVNLKTILPNVEAYMNTDPDVNNELLQYVLTEIANRTDRFDREYQVAISLRSLTRQLARRFLADKYGIPVNWVERGKYKDILEDTQRIFDTHPGGLDEEKIDTYSSALGTKYDIPTETVRSYLETRNDEMFHSENRMNLNTTYTGLAAKSSREILDQLVDTLPEREGLVIKGRFNEKKSLEEVGKTLGVTRERVRQLEAKALRKLRHPSRIRRLREFVLEGN